MRLGLTGGIASGKSTVSEIFARHGAAVVDADVIAREVVQPGHPVLAQIVDEFGTSILHEDGTLHRKQLASFIFQDEQQRKKLEKIMHPAIRKIMKSQIETIETNRPDQLIVVSIPLLFESELESIVHEVMVVYVSEDIQIKRLMARDHITTEQAYLRIRAQKSIEWKKQQADVVIDNTSDRVQTELQVVHWLKEKGYA